MNSPTNYWFRAKPNGCGWDLPLRWQGWVVMLVYFGLMLSGGIYVANTRRAAVFIPCAIVLSLLLVLICWLKGEPLGVRSRAGVAAKDPKALLWFHLLLGPLLLAGALYFRANPPADMNSAYGYRTASSFQSQEVWDEAQRFSANLMLVAAVATLLFEVVVSLTMKPRHSLMATALFMVLAVVLVLPLTERHLKQHPLENARAARGLPAAQRGP
jgi:hypothetical protein